EPAEEPPYPIPVGGHLQGHLLVFWTSRKGTCPLRYLGLPLLASRLSISDCQPLLHKIEARIKGWEGVMLSFAGRVQLIKFVLSALQVYWAMAFILPKHIIKEIEKRLRNFLWKGNLDMGYAKVSWQQVCRPVSEGGLGIRDIHSLNKGLMSRHLWRIIVHDSTSIWVHWILQYRLRDSSVWTIRTQTGSAYERYGGRFTFIGHIITGPQSFGGLRYGGAGGMWLMPRTGHFLLHLSIICGESATSDLSAYVTLY
ncbi:UNVERIFIED_CONTAM: hypothetical protein Sradi_7220300, partial [Sesamum radiatum]